MQIPDQPTDERSAMRPAIRPTSDPLRNPTTAEPSASDDQVDAVAAYLASEDVESHSGGRRRRVWTIVAIVVVVWIVGMTYYLVFRPRADPEVLAKQGKGLLELKRENEKQPDAPFAKVTGKPLYGELAAQRDRMDSTVWAREVQALDYERTLVKLWDDLRAAAENEKLDVLSKIPLESIALGKLTPSGAIEFDARLFKLAEPRQKLTHAQFAQLVERIRALKYVIEQTEWRHTDFVPAAAGGAARSTVEFVIHAHGPENKRRVAVRGNLQISWSDARDIIGLAQPASVDVTDVSMTVRDLAPAFRRLESGASAETSRTYQRTGPVLLYDTDHDGRLEIIAAGQNRVYRWNEAARHYEERVFCKQMPQIHPASVLADVDGDGHVDFICLDFHDRLLWCQGDGEGAFGEPKLAANVSARLAMSMTAGDIDGDGDIDLFVTQFKKPFIGGQFPTPYYDAADGYPAFLLRNDGGGKFTDITKSAGLQKKSGRRSYSSSLIDIDADGNVDLIVTSDFAGVDLYRGDGKGHFQDVTEQWIDQRHSLAVSHLLADFDQDGKLDLFVAAKSSPVARRLERMGVGRTDRPEETKMRATMSYGNRLYLSRNGRFETAPYQDSLAQTGAPWGCAALDFDNDGDVDLFLSNGYQSGTTAKDYASNFWRHDIYSNSSDEDSSVKMLFDNALEQLARGEESWDGYQHKPLLVNRAGKQFVDLAYLLGVAFELDGRTAVAGDLDNDGRVDLVLTQQEIEKNVPHETLLILRNELPTKNHWIGVRLHGSPGVSTIGARVILEAGGTRRAAVITAGNSFGSQMPPVAQFGLGGATKVEKIEIHWPNGKTETIDAPAVDRYHDAGGKPKLRE